jgi:hypothetical protein
VSKREHSDGASGARALLVVLAILVAAGSVAAVKVGADEIRLIRAGDRRGLDASEVTPETSGWVAVSGCVRHDLAVRVTAAGSAAPLVEAATLEGASKSDRVFTPLVPRSDCDEGKPPARAVAWVEDDDALDNTLGHGFAAKVAPPPVEAIVDGVIGYGTASDRLANKARALRASIAGADRAPIIVKGRRPGVLWASAVTVGAGAHGLLLLGVVAWWSRRRARRRHTIRSGETTETEEDFFKSETLD